MANQDFEGTKGNLLEEQQPMDLLWFPAGCHTMQVVLVKLPLHAVTLLRTVTVPSSWPSSSGVELLSGTHEI